MDCVPGGPYAEQPIPNNRIQPIEAPQPHVEQPIPHPATPVVPPQGVVPIQQNIQPAKDEDFGVVVHEIPVPKMSFYFEEPEDTARKVIYSSHTSVISGSRWPQFHESIQGEFFDEEFSPNNPKTIRGQGKADNNEDALKLSKLSNVGFKRLSYAYPNLQVIKDGISSNDIYQGEIGDCYLLSSIASIAEFPAIIERILLQRKRSPKGAYCVALCIGGAFKEYYIDDLVLVRPDNVVKCCYSKEGEIWAILIEKAYAKAYGGIWNISNGGQSTDALMDLTGAPTEWIDLTEKENLPGLFEKIFKADRAQFIMNASSKGEGERASNLGIISGHAYTLMSAVKLSNGAELLKLRNPWGKGEWKGDWGDDSRLWTPAFKSEAGWTPDDDGSFFMNIKDFFKNFDGVSICHYKDDYIQSSLPDMNEDQALAIYQFSVEKEGEYYIGMSQLHKNMFPAGHKYAMLSFVIGQPSDNESSFKYIGGAGQVRRDLWTTINLSPGKYLAFAWTNWSNNNTQDVSFWAYGPSAIPIQRIRTRELLTKCEGYLIECIKDHVKSSSDNSV